jgi:pimeloyl-ACP methyl ester carboxylesterase
MLTAAIQKGSMAIPTKPSVPIAYSFVEGAQQPQGPKTLVVFCSGLCDPMKFWLPTLAATAKEREQKPCPPMLFYDRFGSGATGRDPTDNGKGAKDTHDVMDAVRDLRDLLICIAQRHLAIPSSEIDGLRLVLVAHSMGAVIAELYAKAYPKTVAALLVLDGSPTNSDGESWYPDPDASNFSPAALPEGVTVELLRTARSQQRASVYNPNSVNGEHLRWSNLPDYIPKVGVPKLQGPINGTPLLTVMAHDPVPYAKQVNKVRRSAVNHNTPAP